MPELPEVETIRRYLLNHLVGKTISKIEVLDSSQFVGNHLDAVGKQVVDIDRIGKVLAIKLSDNSYLSFHFKLSGQLLFSTNAKNAVFDKTIPLSGTNKMPCKSTRVIFNFTDGSGLFFNEMRKFGWVKYSKQIEGSKGVDILSPDFTKEYFASKLTNTRRAIKIVLMDQERMAGIGNIYANEALFDAQINPEVAANSLSSEQVNRLFDSIMMVINKGVKYHGSSGRDEVYILPDGSKGEFQYHFTVYQMDGKPCKRCSEKIVRTKVGGRGTFSCPKCQQTLKLESFF